MKNPGKTTDALVDFVDMYPTLCDLCGLDIPEHCEGASFAPLLNDPSLPWKNAAFSQYPRGSIMGYAMRTERYRYIEWQDNDTGEVQARELYDHLRDSQENTNIADGADGSLIPALSTQLRQGWMQALPSK